MKKFPRAGIWIIFLLSLLVPAYSTSALRGVPGSPEFGYGAWLHPSGESVQTASQIAGDLDLDWVALSLDWAALMPEMNSVPDMSMFDAAMKSLKANHASIMISLTNPPDWARNDNGIDPSITAQWVLWLENRYAPALRAIELFPAANTKNGWGGIPNPQQYAALFQQVQSSLTEKGSSLYLIAGGLQPAAVFSDPADWDDITFLTGLYKHGAKDWMSLISLQMPLLSGDPLRPPSSADQHELRHYENIRQVMLENGHTHGMLWITLINPPDGTINPSDRQFLNGIQQAEWQKQALVQMRSQLYIGAVFIQNLNPPPAEDSIFTRFSLISNQQTIHPFYSVLQALIQQTNPNPGIDRPGRPKSLPIPKCQNKK